MTKIFVYAADQSLAEQTVQRLKEAGAEHAEALANLELPTRQPRVNRYLFICETPAEKLRQLVPQVLSEEDYAQTLAQWFEVQYRIVKTAETLKKRAILLSSDQLTNLGELVESINNAWGLSLKPADKAASSSEEAPNQAQEPLLGYLVQNLIELTPPLQALQNLINARACVDNEPLHETDALQGYRGLLQQHNELQTQNHNLTTAQAALNKQLKEVTEESELLLNQLHTVQEELERIFLEAENFKETATKEKADLTAARDAQAKAAADKQKQVEILTQEKATLAKEKADLTAARDAQAKAAADKQKQVEILTQEKATLAKEKADLTAARDAQAKAAAEKQKQVEVLTQEKANLTKEKADLTAARDAQAKAAAEKQKQVEVLTQEKANLTKEKADLTAARDAQAKATKEATEEAGLLLNQLHQVQEELEHYFLKNQEAEAKLDKQQARWQRMLEKTPDFVDAESVKIEVVDSKTQALKWVVQGLESHRISKDYLEFETFVESGVLGIRFSKMNGRNEPTLKNWPAICEGENIDCIPAGKGNLMRQRGQVLRELSATDWMLLNALPQLIKQYLSFAALDEMLCAIVTESTNKNMVGINALPQTFRYDAVLLKSNKVNPDYEHLWFELHNASYGPYYWPKFEFRLGAANIRPGMFSRHPKLELPLIDRHTKPFESWFEESWDENGAKYELRFDLNRNIYDTQTLSKLVNIDQKTVHGLVLVLPKIVKSGFEQGLKAKTMRSADEWISLASDTAREFISSTDKSF